MSAVEFLRSLAQRIEDGQAPMLELTGEAGLTAARLRAVAKDLEARQTVSEQYAADKEIPMLVREGFVAESTVSWKLDDYPPIEVIYTIGTTKSTAHLSAGWVPAIMLQWAAGRVASLLALAYGEGRFDAKREMAGAISTAAKALGVKVEML